MDNGTIAVVIVVATVAWVAAYIVLMHV